MKRHLRPPAKPRRDGVCPGGPVSTPPAAGGQVSCGRRLARLRGGGSPSLHSTLSLSPTATLPLCTRPVTILPRKGCRSVMTTRKLKGSAGRQKGTARIAAKKLECCAQSDAEGPKQAQPDAGPAKRWQIGARRREGQKGSPLPPESGQIPPPTNPPNSRHPHTRQHAAQQLLRSSRAMPRRGQGERQLPHRLGAAQAAAARAAVACRAAAPCWRPRGAAPGAAGCGWPSPAREGGVEQGRSQQGPSGFKRIRPGPPTDGQPTGSRSSKSHACWAPQYVSAAGTAGRAAWGRAARAAGRGGCGRLGRQVAGRKPAGAPPLPRRRALGSLAGRRWRPGEQTRQTRLQAHNMGWGNAMSRA